MKPETYLKTGSEHEHQVVFFMWIALNKQKYPKATKAFAIKNEEKSGSAIVGGRFKATGVKAGTHDILLPVSSLCKVRHKGYENMIVESGKAFSGLFIEMKKLDGSPSADQIAFGLSMEEEGFAWEVCYGWEHAVKVLTDYLDGKFIQKDAEHQKLKYNKK